MSVSMIAAAQETGTIIIESWLWDALWLLAVLNLNGMHWIVHGETGIIHRIILSRPLLAFVLICIMQWWLLVTFVGIFLTFWDVIPKIDIVHGLFHLASSLACVIIFWYDQLPCNALQRQKHFKESIVWSHLLGPLPSLDIMYQNWWVSSTQVLYPLWWPAELIWHCSQPKLNK